MGGGSRMSISSDNNTIYIIETSSTLCPFHAFVIVLIDVSANKLCDRADPSLCFMFNHAFQQLQ